MTTTQALWFGLALAAVLGLLWWLARRGARGDRRRVGSAPATQYASTNYAETQVAEAGDTVVDLALAVAPGRRLGHFRIERDLARGAMGMVMLGVDERSGQPIALKTMALGREFHGQALLDARARFFREAEMAGRLQHPDIVRVLDAGEEGGLAYIAMELLRGHDLSRHAQPATLLPAAQVVATLARVADALDFAHRQGVIHRDIKPANIMVDPAHDSVKVTDFGIAHIADATQTRTGLVLGTPSFMSPEQMAGERVDGRSDLYSLGVTLYQLLTGRLPFEGVSMAALVRAIASEPPPDLRELRPDLPASLAEVVTLALQKRPETRYASGRDFAADLRAVLREIKAAAPVESRESGSVPTAAQPPAPGQNR
ncbi:serine/threonine-protein kinase [Caldimonas sp. KR1-144]|uniref:serine/threonine-protein kinase n=1 Tax=Caldimonas sp. KR1-144 TaxID=3400911 RepID=UPI003C05C146